LLGAIEGQIGARETRPLLGGKRGKRSVARAIEGPYTTPTPYHIYSCSLFTGIYNTLDMAPGVNPIPKNGKLLNILKSIEIPTPKPYMFLFLVLQAIYAIH
jgi:hypothetical protein